MASDPDEDYDPDQSMAERREIQRGMRGLMNRVNENQDDFLAARPKIFDEIMKESDEWIGKSKQTGEAAIDARLMLQVSELMYKRSIHHTSGNAGNGVDVDEFVSKCITYMRQGRGFAGDDAAELSHTQHVRRQNASRGAIGGDDDNEVGDEGDMLNWSHFGRYACVPRITRPALPGFLLGPLSVEKKVRKVAKRTARLKPSDLLEVRPEVLQVEDLAKAEKNDLTAICNKVLARLKKVHEKLHEEAEKFAEEPREEEEAKRYFTKIGLRSTGGLDLLRFVINPHSFGQTVENMFYVSFLIREGKVAIENDEDDLPSLYPLSKEEEKEATALAERGGANKHQAIMSLDMAIWRDCIDIFNITEPMIPHRKEDTHQGPGARGWYS